MNVVECNKEVIFLCSWFVYFLLKMTKDKVEKLNKTTFCEIVALLFTTKVLPLHISKLF